MVVYKLRRLFEWNFAPFVTHLLRIRGSFESIIRSFCLAERVPGWVPDVVYVTDDAALCCVLHGF